MQNDNLLAILKPRIEDRVISEVSKINAYRSKSVLSSERNILFKPIGKDAHHKESQLSTRNPSVNNTPVKTPEISGVSLTHSSGFFQDGRPKVKMRVILKSRGGSSERFEREEDRFLSSYSSEFNKRSLIFTPYKALQEEKKGRAFLDEDYKTEGIIEEGKERPRAQLSSILNPQERESLEKHKEEENFLEKTPKVKRTTSVPIANRQQNKIILNPNLNIPLLKNIQSHSERRKHNKHLESKLRDKNEENNEKIDRESNKIVLEEDSQNKMLEKDNDDFITKLIKLLKEYNRDDMAADLISKKIETDKKTNEEPELNSKEHLEELPANNNATAGLVEDNGNAAEFVDAKKKEKCAEKNEENSLTNEQRIILESKVKEIEGKTVNNEKVRLIISTHEKYLMHIAGICKCFKCTCGHCKCKYSEAKISVSRPGFTSKYMDDYPEKKPIASSCHVKIKNEPFLANSSEQLPGINYESTCKGEFKNPKVVYPRFVRHYQKIDSGPQFVNQSSYKYDFIPLKSLPGARFTTPYNSSIISGMPIKSKTTYMEAFTQREPYPNRYFGSQKEFNPLCNHLLPFVGVSTMKTDFQIPDLKKIDHGLGIDHKDKEIPKSLSYSGHYQSLTKKDYKQQFLNICPAKLIPD